MKTFKPGAFILAKQLQRPILPIVINGTRNALPKHSLSFHGRQNIQIKVLEEIPPENFAHMSAEETGAMVRQIIAKHVDEHRLQSG
jgi:1-acyl-sn-glycerol-3-phosphate acyltransferase